MQEESAAGFIKTQFLMEQMVFSQDRCYRNYIENIFRNKYNPQQAAQRSDILLTLAKELTYYVQAYLKGAADRLSNQIPMIIQFYVLKQHSELLQKEMLQLLHDRDQHNELLQEDEELSNNRNFLSQKKKRLSDGHDRLLCFLGSTKDI
ncbi:interferon-induced GTP-binding protein Mx2-like [Pseudophryne corroboree]|uniref:interferon-induced GTP-binding protein Mx2-like n=1 Tax=Pseudophryne corroboree TaxID=495146 RepID=UPI0030819098